MKLCLLVFLLGTTLIVNADTERSKFFQFVYDRCKQYSLNAASYDVAKGHLESFLDYFNYTTNFIPNGKEQFCNDERPKLISNMKYLAKELDSCFKKEEDYLPRFVAESFTEFLNFLCYNNGLNMDNVFSTAGRECMQILAQHNAANDVSLCFNEIVPNRGLVEKKRLCQNINIAKMCLSKAVDSHCPNFPAFQVLNNKFFQSISKPCNSGALHNINNAVLLIITFFTFNKVF